MSERVVEASRSVIFRPISIVRDVVRRVGSALVSPHVNLQLVDGSFLEGEKSNMEG